MTVMIIMLCSLQKVKPKLKKNVVVWTKRTV